MSIPEYDDQNLIGSTNAPEPVMSERSRIIIELRSSNSRRVLDVAWQAAELLEETPSSAAQPFTPYDLAKAENIVKALHGLQGFDAWSERIAKALAAERRNLEEPK